MTDGDILKRYIDNQSKSKIGIADELGVSKQTLYQYFRSRVLSAEVKTKIEDYFGRDIFSKEAVEEAGKKAFNDIATKMHEAGHFNNKPIESDYVQSLKAQIALHEKINSTLEKRVDKIEANLNEALSNQKVIMTMLTVAMSHAAEFFSSGSKTKADALKRKMMTDIASGHEKIL